MNHIWYAHAMHEFWKRLFCVFAAWPLVDSCKAICAIFGELDVKPLEEIEVELPMAN